ncbi:MAG: dephospho-CoA kinase [Endomicrobiales bacterium]|nr:dephospho-CoA kinase [Endomicrobiales bacterium]
MAKRIKSYLRINNKMKNVTLIGLTGGLSSGKTTVAKEFRKLGAKIIDADKIAHSILKPNTATWKKIVKNFGKDILLSNKTINRSKLAAIIFKNKEKRVKLERITHGVIVKEINKRIVSLSKSYNKKVVIVDAPLLYEAGLTKFMFKNIVVWVPKNIQIKRFKKRNKIFTKSEIISRINAQIPLSKKKKLADFTINNSYHLARVRKRIKNIWLHLTRNN